MNPTDRVEAGETFVELLVAIAILGLAVVVLLTGMTAAVRGSHLHREQTLVDAALRTWGERIGGNVTDATYEFCATPSDYSFLASTAPSAAALPAGATTAVTDILVNSADGTVWSHCGDALPSGAAAVDNGVQEVVLQATVPTANSYPGFTQVLNVVIRKPCDTSC